MSQQPTQPRNGALTQPEPAVIDRLPRNHEDVVRQFQHVMSQFLQTQALIMTAYLQGSGRSSVASLPQAPQAPALPSAFVPIVVPALPSITAPAAAAPAQTVVAETVRPVAVRPVAPARPDPQPVPVALAVTERREVAPPSSKRFEMADVLKHLVHIVSDRTGYPEEMLDVDSNIEADLGIDSIKRMEILAAFQQAHAASANGSFQGAMENLTTIKTLRETATALAELLAPRAEAAIA